MNLRLRIEFGLSRLGTLGEAEPPSLIKYPKQTKKGAPWEFAVSSHGAVGAGYLGEYFSLLYKSCGARALLPRSRLSHYEYAKISHYAKKCHTMSFLLLEVTGAAPEIGLLIKWLISVNYYGALRIPF